MRPLRRSSVALAGVIAAAVGALISLAVMTTGGTPLVAHPVIAVIIAAGAVALVVAGRGVLALKRGTHTWVDPLAASKIALMAQAAALLGAIIAGYMIAQVVVALAWGTDARLLWFHALGSGLCALAGLGLSVCGLLVESWCTIDDDDDESRGGVAQARPA